MDRGKEKSGPERSYEGLPALTGGWPFLFMCMAPEGKSGGMKDYQAEDDLHTLHRAAEVHADGKRLSAAKKLHLTRSASMSKFLGSGKKALRG